MKKFIKKTDQQYLDDHDAAVEARLAEALPHHPEAENWVKSCLQGTDNFFGLPLKTQEDMLNFLTFKENIGQALTDDENKLMIGLQQSILELRKTFREIARDIIEGVVGDIFIKPGKLAIRPIAFIRDQIEALRPPRPNVFKKLNDEET